MVLSVVLVSCSKTPEEQLSNEREEVAWTLKNLCTGDDYQFMHKLYHICKADGIFSYDELMIMYTEFLIINPEFDGKIELPKHLEGIKSDDNKDRGWLDE